MSMISSITEQAQHYSVAELLGIATVGMMAAMVLIALGVRILRGLGMERELEAAINRLQDIEQKLEDLVADSEAMRDDYEKALADEKEAHARELFSLQQTIFERNSEILDLKTDLLELSKHYGNYHYDTLPQ